MTSGTLIRQARLRARLSQAQLSERSGKDRAQIARWERDVVTPSLETLREVLQACGFDLDMQLVLYEPPDERDDARLREELAKNAAGAPPGDARGATQPKWLPRTSSIRTRCLQALEQHLVAYVVIGALGRVTAGLREEITNGVDICTSNASTRACAASGWH